MTSVPEKHPLSILLVDDSTETTHQLAILLQHMRPWRIVSANSLDEAKRHLGSQQRFDVVVTDMVLSPFGDENGIGVIDAVRRSGLSGVPVVAYTAFPGQFAKELDELGVPVVSKIAALDALVRVIEEVATARPVRSARELVKIDDVRQLIADEIERLTPIKARTIVVPGHGVFELVKPLQGYKADIERQLARFPYERNVFLMLKFRDGNKDLSDFIVETLARNGFKGVRADSREWRITGNVFNPIAVLYCCKYGIALFDEAEPQQAYSPNVAYELGMMHYQGKDCLILKHSSLPNVPFDLIKDLYESYSKDLQVRTIVERFVRGLVEDRRSAADS